MADQSGSEDVVPRVNDGNVTQRWIVGAIAMILLMVGGASTTLPSKGSDGGHGSGADIVEINDHDSIRDSPKASTAGLGSSCAGGLFCRQSLSWDGRECAHSYRLSNVAPEREYAEANQKVEVGPDFHLRPRKRGRGNTTGSPLCSVYSTGIWSQPIDRSLLARAADHLWKENPQTDCTIDALESPSTLTWIWEKTNNQSTNELASAELVSSKCTLLRLTDPFDALAHLHVAREKGCARRDCTSSGAPDAPRIDVVGDESHRAMFLRIVAFFRRQPYSFDLEDTKITRMTYRIHTRGDSLDFGAYTISPITDANPQPGGKNDVLLEINFFYFADDANAGLGSELDKILVEVSEGIQRGVTVLAVLGVAYQPSHGCSVDSKPFASGLLNTWKLVHNMIEALMPLDPLTGVVLRNATGVTIISKGAYVPDIRRGDFVPKRNSHARNFIGRHRFPFHTMYMPHYATEQDFVPVHHSHRRLGFIDVHRHLKPWRHQEIDHKTFGDPPMSHSACILASWSAQQGSAMMRLAGNCRDWNNLGMFQLMLTYSNALNPQWGELQS